MGPELMLACTAREVIWVFVEVLGLLASFLLAMVVGYRIGKTEPEEIKTARGE